MVSKDIYLAPLAKKGMARFSRLRLRVKFITCFNHGQRTRTLEGVDVAVAWCGWLPLLFAQRTRWTADESLLRETHPWAERVLEIPWHRRGEQRKPFKNSLSRRELGSMR